MTSRRFRIIGACFSLALWMTTLVSPWCLGCVEDVACMTELEHSEQESEGEELSMEWDEITLAHGPSASSGSQAWHEAQSANMRLHERLDASRLLDPPDKQA